MIYLSKHGANPTKKQSFYVGSPILSNWLSMKIIVLNILINFTFKTKLIHKQTWMMGPQIAWECRFIRFDRIW